MPAFEITIIPVTPFAQNCSLLVCTASRNAAIIDPGGDVDRIRAALDRASVKLEKILLTHGHIDHAGGATELADALSVPIEGPHEADKFLLENLPKDGARFGMSGVRPVTDNSFLDEGDTVRVGELSLEIRHLPGHTPGHIVFIQPEARFAIVGDTLFAGSIGRTDFPYGDHDTLIQGIKNKLLPLGDDVVILPGHGPATNIGAERLRNPFLR